MGFGVGASLDIDFEDFPKPIREGDLSLDFFSGFDDFGERRLGAAPALPRIEERMWTGALNPVGDNDLTLNLLEPLPVGGDGCRACGEGSLILRLMLTFPSVLA